MKGSGERWHGKRAVAAGGAESLAAGVRCWVGVLGLCLTPSCLGAAPGLQRHLHCSPELLSLSQITPHTDSVFPKPWRWPLGGRGCHNRDTQGKLRQI